jgi:hypothetical protein
MRFLQAQKAPPPVRRNIVAQRYVKTEPVQYKKIASEVSERGRLSSIAEIDVIAEASGKIEAGQVSLKKGASFRKGQVLFEIYPDEAELSLQARKSQYQNTLASILPDLVIDYPEAEDAFKDFFSSIRVDRPLPEFPEVKNETLKIFLASRNVISEYYEIKKDELQLKRRIVRAPFDGTYKEVYMETGAYTNMGGRIARAIRTDHLELEVPLLRDDAQWVKLGDPVQLTAQGSDEQWTGSVIRKGQFVDESTQRQSIFIQIKNQSERKLLSGEYFQASFPVRPIEGVMEVPRNSVFNSNEVFVVRSGRLAKEKIKVIKVNERTLIFNGLPAGDTLVVQQLINVSEGTLVLTDLEAASKAAGARGKPEQAKANKPQTN